MNQPSFVLGPTCSDGMVLQRGRAVLWGWSDPGTAHRFEVAGAQAPAVAGPDGSWQAVWDDLPPGGPHRLFHNGRVLFESVWVGDVWLCAGQSNMERSLEACAVWPSDAQEHGGDAGIRQCCLPNQFDFSRGRREIPGARWIGADAEVGKISAAAYHFAKDLRGRTGVPQGLVLAAVGGSTAQAWLPVEDLTVPAYRAEVDQYAQPGWLAGVQRAEEVRRNQWFAALEALDPKDPARAGSGAWRPLVLPSLFRDNGVGDRTGSVWLRKRLALGAVGDGAGRVRLGTLVDSDEVWVNGTSVGSTAYQYPSRRYNIPAGVLRRGDNEILIRIVAPLGGVGATPDKVWELQAGETSLDLAGEWEWRPGADASELPADTFLPLISSGLYYGLLVPLAPLAFRAVLWYQGESNLAKAGEYEALMTALLARWRRLFGRPELPFVLVQLPLFGAEQPFSAEEGWAVVREAQRRLAETPHTALVITLDAGEWNDIHPSRKAIVGDRMALAARRLVLGEPLATWTGPLLTGRTAGAGALHLSFTQRGGGLETRDGQPCLAFFLAGADGVFHRAEATVSPDSVVVRSPLVPEPVEVRYAWASNPSGANLVNSLGIPASPFRA